MKNNDIKEKIKYISIMSKYLLKCRKLNISKDFLTYLAYRSDMQDVKDILMLIRKSNDAIQFSNNIINYLKSNPNNICRCQLLVGIFLGRYNYCSVWNCPSVDDENVLNFNCHDRKGIIEILRNKFIEYILSDNRIKNLFFSEENGVRNLSKDLNYDEINKLFDDVVNGIEIHNDYSGKLGSIYVYIFKILNNYTLDDILNNFEFIMHDLMSRDDASLSDKRDKFNKNRDLKESVRIKLDNIDTLKNRLKRINNSEAKKLLERINNIYENPDDIEDIYLEYETLFREDLISHLFVPVEQVTVVEDFRDVRPQLIHCFIRGTEKLRESLERKIVDKIISERNDGNTDRNLTEEEQRRFNMLLNRLEAELDQTQVNYSFDSSVGIYSDTLGLDHYMSDTSNQISASVYSNTFFNMHSREMIGIGFNADGLTPEGIALSSPRYLTTNKGLNNIEYDPSNEDILTSACYDELIQNDGNSEVVLFRNNTDFDTRAAYVFVAFDSERNPNYQELINRGKELVEKNKGMKLVLYDLAKIRRSYKKFVQESEKGVQIDKSTKQNMSR